MPRIRRKKQSIGFLPLAIACLECEANHQGKSVSDLVGKLVEDWRLGISPAPLSPPTRALSEAGATALPPTRG